MSAMVREIISEKKLHSDLEELMENVFLKEWLADRIKVTRMVTVVQRNIMLISQHVIIIKFRNKLT